MFSLIFQFKSNLENILNQIDFWFLHLTTSLQQATKNLQAGAEQSVREAETRLEELGSEILDCLDHDDEDD